jgi:hypothetical protein
MQEVMCQVDKYPARLSKAFTVSRRGCFSQAHILFIKKLTYRPKSGEGRFQTLGRHKLTIAKSEEIHSSQILPL